METNNIKKNVLHCLEMPRQTMDIEYIDEGDSRIMYYNPSDGNNRYNAKLMMLKDSMFFQISQPLPEGPIAVVDFTENVNKFYLEAEPPKLPKFGFSHGDILWVSSQAVRNIGKTLLMDKNQSQGGEPYGMPEMVADRRRQRQNA